MSLPVTAPERALVELARGLRSDQLITDADVRASYASDESEAPPVLPHAVVRARSAQDVQLALEVANRFGVPLTPRAGGTGRSGGAIPVQGGLVLAFEGMRQICEVHREDLVAVVEPGVVLSDLHAAVEAEGLFYPPDPNSLGSCCLGGNLAENSGGPRALKYGVTRNYTLGLEVVTGAGTPLSLGKRTVKGVTGYDLTALMVGSEGTLAVTTRATLRLVPKPAAVGTLLVFLPEASWVRAALSSMADLGLAPRCAELMDEYVFERVKRELQLSPPMGSKAVMLIEFDGTPEQTERDLERCGNGLIEAGAIDVIVARHGGEREKLWAARREMTWSLKRAATHKLAHDVVVPRSRLPELLAVTRELSEQHGIPMPCYGHAGDGCLHVSFLWDTPAQGVEVERAVASLFRHVVRMHGSLTSEHGVGLTKRPYLHLEHSPQAIEAQRGLKALFDPNGVLNPGKLLPDVAD